MSNVSLLVQDRSLTCPWSRVDLKFSSAALHPAAKIPQIQLICYSVSRWVKRSCGKPPLGITEKHCKKTYASPSLRYLLLDPGVGLITLSLHLGQIRPGKDHRWMDNPWCTFLSCGITILLLNISIKKRWIFMSGQLICKFTLVMNSCR